MKTIFYWSPCLSKVGTVKSTVNSALALSKYSKREYKTRGTVFEWFCKFYLLTNPVYRITYKRVLHSSEFLQNATICKRLGFTKNKEEGCDLIGETHEGKYEIIQCKYKDNKYENLDAGDVESSIRVATATKASAWVDTILSCSNRQGLTDNEFLKDHPLQFRTCLRGNFELLSNQDFQNIKATIKDLIPTYDARTPMGHQIIARDAVCKHFKHEARGQIVHACGTGKTLRNLWANAQCLYRQPC